MHIDRCYRSPRVAPANIQGLYMDRIGVSRGYIGTIWDYIGDM